MTMKSDAKFEEQLTFRFQTDIMNLTNFDPSTQKSQKSAPSGVLLIKVCNVLDKRVQKSYV